MPTVTKHTTNNLVTVSYPVREAVLDITHAEHDLILMFRTEKVKMIKFIRSQYNLGLFDAKQLVDTVITSAEAEAQLRNSSAGVETEVDWSTIPEGNWIYVREHDATYWCLRQFIRKESGDYLPFV